MLPVQTARFCIRVEQHSALKIDAIGITIIVGALDTRPAEVLCYSTRLAPPVCEADLHPYVVACGVNNRSIQLQKGFFVPVIRSPTIWVGRRLSGKIRDTIF